MPGVTQLPPLDFASIAESADLISIAERDGVEIRNGKALCPFHDNTISPALSFYQSGGRWRFKCHGCGIAGDAIAWVAAREDLSTVRAAKRLAGLDDGPARPRVAPRPKLAPSTVGPSPIDDPEWHRAVDAIVRRGERALWGPAGRDALAYLRSRGLADRTIRHHRLGFIPAWFETHPIDSLRARDGRDRGIQVARGITIPWLAPGACHDPEVEPEWHRWVGCQVRRLAGDVFEPMPHDQKCHALAGSVRGYGFPYADLLPDQSGVPALVCEGEFDALLAHQEAGQVVNAFTVGGSSQTPHPTALEALGSCPVWLLAFDHDEAGVKAALRWRGWAPGDCRRLLLPFGDDLGEFVEAGGDLRKWLRSEMDRFGIEG